MKSGCALWRIFFRANCFNKFTIIFMRADCIAGHIITPQRKDVRRIIFSVPFRCTLLLLFLSHNRVPGLQYRYRKPFRLWY